MSFNLLTNQNKYIICCPWYNLTHFLFRKKYFVAKRVWKSINFMQLIVFASCLPCQVFWLLKIRKIFCVVFTGQLVDWLTIFLSGYNYKYFCETGRFKLLEKIWRKIHKSFNIDTLWVILCPYCQYHFSNKIDCQFPNDLCK